MVRDSKTATCPSSGSDGILARSAARPDRDDKPSCSYNGMCKGSPVPNLHHQPLLAFFPLFGFNSMKNSIILVFLQNGISPTGGKLYSRG
jgi:hypothetical protein